MIVTAREYTAANAAEMAGNAAAIRARLMKPRNAIRKAIAPPTPKPIRDLPAWTYGLMRFDEHVIAFEKHKIEALMIGAHRLKRYIRDRAFELGRTYAEVVGHSRKRSYVKARDLIVWEIKTQVKPDISYPELAKLFGGRDHSSIHYSVRKIEAMRASA